MDNAFANYKLPEAKKAPAHYFQAVALEALQYIDQPVKSQVFKWSKTQEGKLKAALEYMRSRDIKSFRYLAKIMSNRG